jgi:uncharacterized protein (TIGR01777 family)
VRIAVTGASGFIGSALCADLEASGHAVSRVGRQADPNRGGVRWDPQRGMLDAAALEGHDAVVHLAGESIASGRWTAVHKTRIRTSRVQSTQLLAATLAHLQTPPAALLCASASGWYGDRGATRLDENSPPGTGFLPEVCREWEAAAEPAQRAGIRVVHLRFGLVLDPKGGLLQRLRAAARWGLAAPLGSGRQYMPWVTLADLVGVVRFGLAAPLAGPVNVVAGAVPNRDFTRTLNQVLRRPTPPAVPAWLLRLLFGEMADTLLLGSARVESVRLPAAGHRFQHTELGPALRDLLRNEAA